VPIARYPYYYEKKQQKPWFETEYSNFFYSKNGAKLQWSQDPSKTKEDNHSYPRSKTSRHFLNDIGVVF
jgi:hypothetical protein